MPIQDKKKLIENLEESIAEIEEYFNGKRITPRDILDAQGDKKLKLIDEAVDVILVNDESRATFLALVERVTSAYADILPNPLANPYLPIVTLYVVLLETIHSEIPEIDISNIMNQIEDLLDNSIVVKEYKPIKDREPRARSLKPPTSYSAQER